MPPSLRRQGGFTLLWVLFLVASLGIGMAALGTVWHTAAQREKETELLFVGDQYRRAIESFWQASPGDQKRLPKKLDELLLDPRFPQTVRHLRRLYRDPMTGAAEWGLVKGANDGIAGVYSLSEASPLKTAGFPQRYAAFAAVPSYRDWTFTSEINPQGGGETSPLPSGGGTGANTGASDGATSSPAHGAAQGGGASEASSTQAICTNQRTAAFNACIRDQVPNSAAYNACISRALLAFQECLRTSP